MSRLMVVISASAVVATSGYAPPAVAQSSAPSAAEVIVYGNDPCPRSTDDQVVVCSRRPEGERYRIPRQQRTNGTRQQNESWSRRSQAIQSAGATGINSCSPVGPNGYTGCLIKEIESAKGQRQQQASDETPPQR